MSDIPNIPLTDDNIALIIKTVASKGYEDVRQVFSEDRSRLVYHEGSSQRGYIMQERTQKFVIVDFGEGAVMVCTDFIVLVDNPPSIKPPPFVRVKVQANVKNGVHNLSIADVHRKAGYLTGKVSERPKQFQVKFDNGRLLYFLPTEIIIEDVQCQK
jgi:hypothetical protein